MTRLNRRLLLGAIAVLVPALAGCEAGLNAPTLEFHPASSGVSITQNGITLDNVFVLGPPLGSALPPGGRAGVFLSIEAENGDRLVSVSAPGTASAVRLTGGPGRPAGPDAGRPERPRAQAGAHQAGQSAPRRDDGSADPHLPTGGGGHGQRAGRAARLRLRDLLPAAHPQAHAVSQAQGARVRLGVGQCIGGRCLGDVQPSRQPVGHAVAGQVRTHLVRSVEKIFYPERTGVLAFQYLLFSANFLRRLIRICILGRVPSRCAAAGRGRPRSWPAAA